MINSMKAAMLALLLVMKLSLSLRYGLRMHLLILGPKKWTEMANQQKKKHFHPCSYATQLVIQTIQDTYILDLPKNILFPGLLLKKMENSQEHC